MKRTLFLTMALAACFHTVQAATYTNLQESWCDDINNVIYNGRGYFAVQSEANTSLELTLNLNSLYSYVNSNDYSGSSYMLLWENNIQNYGLGDNANTADATGSRTPYLSGWTSAAWNASSNNVTYSTLQSYADTTGNVVLSITNSKSNGVTVTAKDAQGTAQTLYSAGGLRYSSMTGVSGYYVNLNYVTAVTLHTASSLDTDSYVPPKDYRVPFESQRTDGTSIGRVTFLGDSITHGVNDQSYRWQLFKTLTDNGIENEIVGPREGYYSTPNHTEDAGSSYGGVEFANVHLAQASGRTHNIISGSNSGMTGVNYGGHSTASTGQAYDSNTWFCMMGTNDMLSDSGSSTADYCNKMAKMLGGTVSYSESSGYTWVKDESNWGTMGTIVKDVHGEGDTFYMLSITPWGRHANSNTESYHFGAQEFNRNLALWVDEYKAATGKNVVYVDVTRGMVDKTSSISFYGHDAFFNTPGSDGLHPNDQGSLIMAGNLAQAMGIGGRTAGLDRADASTSGTVWMSAESVIALGAGQTQMLATDAFTMENGYTVDFSAVFGDGSANGWADAASSKLDISIGDGTNSGTLTLTEGYIKWGNEVLFCQDNSLTGNDSLRIAWHNGSSADNVLKGYYVWLGDMLIGQGLTASSGQGLNGVTLTTAGGSAQISNLIYSNTAYAPTTQGTFSAEYAYKTTQDAAAVSGFVANSFSSGVDFSGANEVSKAGGQLVTSADITENTTNVTEKLTSSSGWVGVSGCSFNGDINVQVTGAVTHTVFGAMGGASGSNILLELTDDATIGGGIYNGQTAAIAGSYGGGTAESFTVYVNGGTIGGDIVGGSINANGKIKDANIVVNGGTISADIVAGSKITNAAAAVDNASVTVTGGKITGNITKGNAGSSTVTVLGNKASIGGGIEADKVALRNVAAGDSDTGFDKYSGTIKADTLVLDNAFMKHATVKGLTQEDVMASVSVLNGAAVELNAGDSLSVDSLELDGGTSLGLFKSADSHDVSTEAETTLTVTGTLNLGGAGAILNANLVMANGSTLDMAGNSLQLGSSLTLGGVTLDGVSMESILALEYGASLTLFTGVDELILSGTSYTEAAEFAASVAFSNPELASNYLLQYGGAASGTLSVMAVPEPASATLSLLALTALAARRRRR